MNTFLMISAYAKHMHTTITKNLLELLDLKDENDYIIPKCKKIKVSQIVSVLMKGE